MEVALTSAVVTTVLGASTRAGHGVWFQLYNTTADVYLRPVTSETDLVPSDDDLPDTAEFAIMRAPSATTPTTLILQASGGDTTLIRCAWKAIQISGGAVNLYCGRW